MLTFSVHRPNVIVEKHLKAITTGTIRKCIETVTNYTCGFLKSLKRGLTEAWIADDIKEEDVIRINDMDQGQQQHQIKTSKYGYGE